MEAKDIANISARRRLHPSALQVHWDHVANRDVRYCPGSQPADALAGELRRHGCPDPRSRNPSQGSCTPSLCNGGESEHKTVNIRKFLSVVAKRKICLLLHKLRFVALSSRSTTSQPSLEFWYSQVVRKSTLQTHSRYIFLHQARRRSTTLPIVFSESNSENNGEAKLSRRTCQEHPRRPPHVTPEKNDAITSHVVWTCTALVLPNALSMAI